MERRKSLRNSELQIIYRLSPPRNHAVRPSWFSQDACLKSLLQSVQFAKNKNFSVRLVAVVDGDVDVSVWRLLECFNDVVSVQVHGNSRAFRVALHEAVKGLSEFTLLAEDDYMWRPESIYTLVQTLAALPPNIFLSPYCHPIGERSDLSDVKRHRRRDFTVHGSSFHTVSRTTMTFATRTENLNRTFHLWWLASYGASTKAGYVFWALCEGRFFFLFGNAAFRDWSRVLNKESVRSLFDVVRRRLFPSERMILVQPNDSLATHVHIPYISGLTAWDALAAQVADSFEGPGGLAE